MFSPFLSRRAVLRTTLGFATTLALRVRPAQAQDAVAAGPADAAEAKVQQAHAELWRRFIDEHDILVDYADTLGKFPRPTPAECRAGKPNALGWWTATENGSMFSGMYLDGAVLRAKATGAPVDRTRAQRLVKGLLRLASLGPPGFIARCVATDGRTPYPMGSDDQTGPWFYGLWRYVHEGLAEPEERAVIVAKFVEVARVLESSGWRMPCNEGAPSPYRGTFAGHSWQHAPRLLFLLKATHALTGDAHWDELYRAAVAERGGDPARTRAEICAAGMVFHNAKWRASWTGASSVIALRGLWELETDAELRAAYAQGLAASAAMAAPGVPLALKFDNASQAAFLHDWRVLNEWWQPQASEAEAVEVAERQSKELGRLSPRRYAEFVHMREPLFAAWVVTLCPDAAVVGAQREAILTTLAHYDYAKLNYSQFFPAEAAWYRLQAHAAP